MVVAEGAEWRETTGRHPLAMPAENGTSGSYRATCFNSWNRESDVAFLERRRGTPRRNRGGCKPRHSLRSREAGAHDDR
jgi:hypothetical protein